MRNLYLNAASLFTMCLAAPLFAQDGELKSVLVQDDLRPLVDQEDRPDAPEPTRKTEPEPSLDGLNFPAKDTQPNPIPGLEPIAAPRPQPALEAPKPVVAPRPRVSAQPVASPAPAVQRPTVTMSSVGFSLVPDADVPRVRGVIVDGLAQQSGMQPGDFISAINETPTKTPADVQRLLAALNTDEFDVAVVRGGRRRSIRLRVPRANRRVVGRPLPVQRASTRQQQRLINVPEAIQPVPATIATPDPTAPQVIQQVPLPIQQVRPVQRQYVRRPAQPARPLIGDGGRMIGNGRVINSVRRLFSW